MSNHLAIATVTAAFAQRVQAAAQKAVGGATVEIGRPRASDTNDAPHRINLYLYQVTPNMALRNADLPARNSKGNLSQRQQVALDLHYLLVFQGDARTFEPERMLGAVVRDLHAQPLLTQGVIKDAIASNPDLIGSNLSEALEPVRLTPQALSLEELSKLWSVFFQTPHALTVAYQGAMVLIEAEEGAAPAPPVLERGRGDHGVDTQIGPFPRLESIFIGEPADTNLNLPAAADLRPRPPSYPAARLGLQLVLSGENLAGDAVQVEFAHQGLGMSPPPLHPSSTDATEIRVDLPAPNDVLAQSQWTPGMYGVRVLVWRGDTVKKSNALPLALAPCIVKIEPDNPIAGAGGDIELTVTCSPQVLPKQKAELLLADRQVIAQERTKSEDPLKFVVKSAPALEGAPARVRVDGVESMPFKRSGNPPRLLFDDACMVTIR